VLPVNENAGGGSNLTISSGAAHHAIEAWSHYCASKAAVNYDGAVDPSGRSRNDPRHAACPPGTVATADATRESKQAA